MMNCHPEKFFTCLVKYLTICLMDTCAPQSIKLLTLVISHKVDICGWIAMKLGTGDHSPSILSLLPHLYFMFSANESILAC